MPSPSDHQPPSVPLDVHPVALRVDAARNRAVLVEAARAAFAERGLDVPLDEIAHRAGVGIATLYRRFPTREDLIAASFAPLMAAYADAVEEALQVPDAWTAFAGYVERVCALQATDCGLRDVLTLTFPMAPAFEAQRQRAYDGFTTLVRRAQDAGVVRRDFVPEDLVLLLMANAGVVQGTRDAAPAAWRRFVGLMLEAVRAERAHPLPPAPPPDQMYQALLRIGHSGAPTGHGQRAPVSADDPAADAVVDAPR